MQTLPVLPAWLFFLALVLLGLIVGSFLNVVISRLPRMMEAQWQRDAADILGQPAPPVASQSFNIAVPRSACPSCGAPVGALHNLPVISFVLLRGRCAHCRESISWQYPLVELLAAAMAVVVGWRFGASAYLPLALILSWGLLALAAIDWQTQLLPDSITLSLLWVGLIASIGWPVTSGIDPVSSIVGAAAGYGVLWLVFQLFLMVTGKHGMGHGDFKLLAALGAWLGWQQLPLVLLMASLAGAVVGGVLMASGRIERGRPMPFGPWLVIAGWLALVAGDTIVDFYLSVSGLR